MQCIRDVPLVPPVITTLYGGSAYSSRALRPPPVLGLTSACLARDAAYIKHL